MRICYTCKEEKPLSDFYSGKCYKDGYDIYCKVCARKGRQDNERNPKGNRNSKRLATDVLFRCPKCKSYKSPDNFYINSTGKTISGYSTYCKDCDRERKLVTNLSDYAREEKRKREAIRLRDYPELERKRKLEIYHKYKHSPKWRANKSRVETKRRSNVKNVVNDLTAMNIVELLAIQDNECAACHIKFSKNNRYTVDHIMPVSKGGGLTFDNVQLLCKHCNCSKGAKTIVYRKM